MCQRLVTIGRDLRAQAAKKDLNTSSLLQWPSASQLKGGYNKTGNAYRIAKKFAANIVVNN